MAPLTQMLTTAATSRAPLGDDLAWTIWRHWQHTLPSGCVINVDLPVALARRHDTPADLLAELLTHPGPRQRTLRALVANPTADADTLMQAAEQLTEPHLLRSCLADARPEALRVLAHRAATHPRHTGQRYTSTTAEITPAPELIWEDLAGALLTHPDLSLGDVVALFTAMIPFLQADFAERSPQVSSQLRQPMHKAVHAHPDQLRDLAAASGIPWLLYAAASLPDPRPEHLEVALQRCVLDWLEPRRDVAAWPAAVLAGLWPTLTPAQRERARTAVLACRTGPQGADLPHQQLRDLLWPDPADDMHATLAAWADLDGQQVAARVAAGDARRHLMHWAVRAALLARPDVDTDTALAIARAGGVRSTELLGRRPFDRSYQVALYRDDLRALPLPAAQGADAPTGTGTGSRFDANLTREVLTGLDPWATNLQMRGASDVRAWLATDGIAAALGDAVLDLPVWLVFGMLGHDATVDATVYGHLGEVLIDPAARLLLEDLLGHQVPQWLASSLQPPDEERRSLDRDTALTVRTLVATIDAALPGRPRGSAAHDVGVRHAPAGEDDR